jgi:hypothetical protein
MATLAQCREAIERFAAQLAGDPDPARAEIDRSFVCHITDLDASFHGRLARGAVVGPHDGDDPGADVRLALSGDTLLSLVGGEVSFAKAWATGRISVRASFRDLLRLRKLV